MNLSCGRPLRSLGVWCCSRCDWARDLPASFSRSPAKNAARTPTATSPSTASACFHRAPLFRVLTRAPTTRVSLRQDSAEVCVTEENACFADAEGCWACLEAADMLDEDACSDPERAETCSGAAEYLCCSVGEDCSDNQELIDLLSESLLDRLWNPMLPLESLHALVALALVGFPAFTKAV